jgi:hypothetical protein
MCGIDPDYSQRDLFDNQARRLPQMAREYADHAREGGGDLLYQSVRSRRGVTAWRLSFDCPYAIYNKDGAMKFDGNGGARRTMSRTALAARRRVRSNKARPNP